MGSGLAHILAPGLGALDRQPVPTVPVRAAQRKRPCTLHLLLGPYPPRFPSRNRVLLDNRVRRRVRGDVRQESIPPSGPPGIFALLAPILKHTLLGELVEDRVAPLAMFGQPGGSYQVPSAMATSSRVRSSSRGSITRPSLLRDTRGAFRATPSVALRRAGDNLATRTRRRPHPPRRRRPCTSTESPAHMGDHASCSG